MDNFKLDELDNLVKKLMRSIYIEKCMSGKSVSLKLAELSNVKTTDKVVLCVVSSILKYDVIQNIIEKNKYYYYDCLIKYIMDVNNKYKFRLEEIINNGIIDSDKLDEVLELIDNIEGLYYYNNRLKDRENMKDELNKLKVLVDKKSDINDKLYPLISLISDEIGYINSLEVPKTYMVLDYIKYKDILKCHRLKIFNYVSECIGYLSDDKSNYMSGYFYYEESIEDIIVNIKECLEKDNYICIFDSLKYFYDVNVEGIRISKKDIVKKEKRLNRYTFINNPYYDRINDIVLNKKSRCICYIVNFLYKINVDVEKQNFFCEILYTLRLLYSVSINYPFNIVEFSDSKISFLNMLFNNEVDEKVILDNVDLCKKMIDLYKDDAKVKKMSL